jgi:predicted DNA-binding protein (UPF0278 family)
MKLEIYIYSLEKIRLEVKIRTKFGYVYVYYLGERISKFSDISEGKIWINLKPMTRKFECNII